MTTKMSMPARTLTSPSRLPISHPSQIHKTTSFPTYLDPPADQETFLLIKLGVSTRHHPVDDREIDVFDAQKYFNEGFDRRTKVDDPNLQKFKLPEEPIKSAPPKMSTLRSTRSESSANSRSALLLNNRLRKSLRKGFLASIICNCSCADKSSVDIDDCTDMNKSQQGDKIRDCLVRETGSQGAPILENLKKLNMMSWDGTGKEINKIPSMEDEDDDSDGSSDLFEIESLSKGKPPFLSRQTSDGLSGAGYPPSEASIEWSVVTASAGDFSAVSDSEELGLDKVRNKGGLTSKFKDIPKLRPGILSGCKNEKAISVAGNAHRSNEPGIVSCHGRNMTRFRDQNKLGGFGAKIRPQILYT